MSTTIRRVVAIDHRFPNLDPEAEVLARVGAEVLDLRGLSDEEVLAQAGGAAGVLLGARFQLHRARIDRLEGCRVIVRYGVGVDNVDLAAAAAKGIVVSFVPDYCVEEVANHATALLLALHRQLAQYDAAARAGRAGINSAQPIKRLSTMSLGVVGFGRIGREVARRAQALGMRVLVHDSFLTAEQVTAAGGTSMGLSELIAEADVITLHVPLTPATRNLLDADALARMRAGALIVNVGRGGLIDESALADALSSGRIGGAGLDVTSSEPLPPGHPLLAAPNVILTPHVAWYSTGAQRSLQVMAAEEVARVLSGGTALHAL